MTRNCVGCGVRRDAAPRVEKGLKALGGLHRRWITTANVIRATFGSLWPKHPSDIIEEVLVSIFLSGCSFSFVVVFSKKLDFVAS